MGDIKFHLFDFLLFQILKWPPKIRYLVAWVFIKSLYTVHVYRNMLTYCRHIVLLLSTSASASASYQLLRTPCSNLFLGVNFLLPRSLLSFDFRYDLDIWVQGQALRVFLLLRVFHYFIKSMMGILIKHGRKLHRHLVHDPMIANLPIDLHLRKLCSAKTSCLVTQITKLQKLQVDLPETLHQ